MPKPGITWPLFYNKIRRGLVCHTFGERIRRNGTRPHQGWDFYAAPGTPVYAIGGGEVRFVRDGGDYGLQVCHTIELETVKYFAFYAHLSVPYVKAGDRVELDQLIALSGNSGNARSMKGPDQHLHFEIRKIEGPGFGTAGRVSPIKAFGFCPLHAGVLG